MKKKLFFTNNDKGFILPHVLLIVTVLLIYTFSNLDAYQNEIELSYLYIDQLMIETLFQKGYMEIKEKYATIEDLRNDRQNDFDYPHGEVRVEFFSDENDSDKGYLHFSIETINGSLFSLVKPIQSPWNAM